MLKIHEKTVLKTDFSLKKSVLKKWAGPKNGVRVFPARIIYDTCVHLLLPVNKNSVNLQKRFEGV